MGIVDPATALLATCGGDTVKLFDVAAADSSAATASGAVDPCVLAYTPSPRAQVNCVKWNHTNLVVASAGDDKKISLWHKNGQSVGELSPSGVEVGDGIEETFLSISFSNKGSRYLCSGGSGRIVKVWDLQRKRCIKWLSGHSDTITGVLYNCKDEYLASISLNGDLILHNLVSGARAAGLKDPHGQVLRVLDYSRVGRYILVTAGDDGSVHLWDTSARSPKVSWLKQHSAPTTGICFSPLNDKVLTSVGLDKKLYTFDSNVKRPTYCIPCEAPLSSLGYNDNGTVLAAGTNNGQVLFFDVRAKPQPFTVLRAYNSSEAITSLCWQRSKPVIVNETNCSTDVALLGGTSEESVLMPDPLPSSTASSFTSGVSTSSLHTSFPAGTSGFLTSSISSVDETPLRSQLFTGGGFLSKLQATRTNLDGLKDDMDVFSPIVEVQPFTPSRWDDHDDTKNDAVAPDRKAGLFSSSSISRYDDNGDAHNIADRRVNSSSKQDDTSSAALPTASSSTTSTFSTAADAFAGYAFPERYTQRQQVPLSRFGPSSSFASSTFAASQDSSSLSYSRSILSNSNLSMNLRSKDSLSTTDAFVFPESPYARTSSSTSSLSMVDRPMVSSTHMELLAPKSTLARRYQGEGTSTSSVFSEGAALAAGSPKLKKTGAETREDILNRLSLKHEIATTSSTPSHLPVNEVPQSTDQQQEASNFSLRLFQRTLEETLGSVRKSIHDDVKNLHIDLIRQFHMMDMEMLDFRNSVLENQEALAKEVQQLRKENQQLRQLLFSG